MNDNVMGAGPLPSLPQLALMLLIGAAVFGVVLLCILSPLLTWLACNHRLFETAKISLRSIFWLMFACGVSCMIGMALFGMFEWRF